MNATDTVPFTDREVSMAHEIDDLCREVAAGLQALNHIRWALGIAADADRNGDAPSVVTEYIDRALTAASEAVGAVA